MARHGSPSPAPIPFWESPKPRNQRLDLRLYETAGLPCFVTIRTYGKTRPFEDPVLADIAQALLLGSRRQAQCEIDAYCILPDHVQLVVTSSEDEASSLRFAQQS